MVSVLIVFVDKCFHFIWLYLKFRPKKPLRNHALLKKNKKINQIPLFKYDTRVDTKVMLQMRLNREKFAESDKNF